jgi:hypothetical protein
MSKDRLKKSGRKALPLCRSIQQLLSTYTAAAGAAGVTLMALAPVAGAEIVYTPANQTIGRDESYNLDLNNDGIVDLILTEHVYKDGSFGGTDQVVALEAAAGNQAVCPSTFCVSGQSYAEPLTVGASIRPDIRPRGWMGRHIGVAFEVTFEKGGNPYYGYGWTNVRNRYLGLKFKVDGEYHYGWARLSLQFHAGSGQDRSWVAQLTGYAYETVAGKSIIAGQTEGSDESDESKDQSGIKQTACPAALGALARGAAGVALWREEVDNAGRAKNE